MTAAAMQGMAGEEYAGASLCHSRGALQCTWAQTSLFTPQPPVLHACGPAMLALPCPAAAPDHMLACMHEDLDSQPAAMDVVVHPTLHREVGMHGSLTYTPAGPTRLLHISSAGW